MVLVMGEATNHGGIFGDLRIYARTPTSGVSGGLISRRCPPVCSCARAVKHLDRARKFRPARFASSLCCGPRKDAF